MSHIVETVQEAQKAKGEILGTIAHVVEKVSRLCLDAHDPVLSELLIAQDALSTAYRLLKNTK